VIVRQSVRKLQVGDWRKGSTIEYAEPFSGTIPVEPRSTGIGGEVVRCARHVDTRVNCARVGVE